MVIAIFPAVQSVPISSNELIPVRAGMVGDLSEYLWSSYRANGLGKLIKFWRSRCVYQQLGTALADCPLAYRELLKGHLDKPVLNTSDRPPIRGWRLVVSDSSLKLSDCLVVKGPP